MVVSDGDAMLELGVVVEQVHNLETAPVSQNETDTSSTLTKKLSTDTSGASAQLHARRQYLWEHGRRYVVDEWHDSQWEITSWIRSSDAER
jgi:hypothetical protein